MKKNYLILCLSSLALFANAQQKIERPLTSHPAIKFASNPSLINNSAVTNTLMPATFMSGGCATMSGGIVYYSNFSTSTAPNYTTVGVGYNFGTNTTSITISGFPSTVIGVSNKAAQKYNVTGNVSVTGVIIGNNIAHGTALVKAVIYNENATTKGPGTQVGVVGTKALNTFSGSGVDLISFGTPVALPAGNFFASIESPTIGGANMDTLSILATNTGCSSTDSLAWIYTSYTPALQPAGWESVKKFSGSNSNLDLFIFPVVDVTTGVGSISKNGLTLSSAYPNPATNDLSVNFGLDKSSKIEIEIFDVTGKLIKTTSFDNLMTGNQTIKIDISTLNSGVYMYSISSENAKLFSKFTVAK